MKIFILGLPQSGRTVVAKAISQNNKYYYIDSSHWFKDTYRPKLANEHIEQYHDTYHQYVLDRLINDPNLFSRHIINIITNSLENNFVIDGTVTPRDFITLFDPSQDFVVFLNRIDNEDIQVKDYEKIAISVMRDYCFWLSSANLLSRDKWHEYNFKMTNGNMDRFKVMGSKNKVFIVGSLNKVIDNLKETLSENN